MLPFTAAIEPLRLANRASGQTLFDWRLVGPRGDVATCSNGTRVMLDGGLDLDAPPPGRDEVVIVCGGTDIAREATRPVLSWLRRQARRNPRLRR